MSLSPRSWVSILDGVVDIPMSDTLLACEDGESYKKGTHKNW